MIALDFPVFCGDRSCFTAIRFRTIHHYPGKSRAVENVLVDQVSSMLCCGFDTFEITHPLTRMRIMDYTTGVFPGFYHPGTGLVCTGIQRIWCHVSVEAGTVV